MKFIFWARWTIFMRFRYWLYDIIIFIYCHVCFPRCCRMKYYNGCLFHTIQKDFTAQTGDLTGTGSGGDSIYKYEHLSNSRSDVYNIFPCYIPKLCWKFSLLMAVYTSCFFACNFLWLCFVVRQLGLSVTIFLDIFYDK